MMIAASASQVATPVLHNALVDVSWTVLLPYCMIVAWLLVLCVILLVPTLRATMFASLYALKGIKQGLFLWTETDKKSGQWFARITGIAVVDSDRNVVRVFYGKVHPQLFKEFQK